VTHADAHNRNLGGFKEFAEVVHGGVAVSWVSWPVGNEDTIKVMSNPVDGIIEGEASDAGSSGDKAAENVLLDSTIDKSNVHVPERGANMERGLGAHPAYKVDGFRVNVGFIFIGIILLSNGDASQR